MTNARARKPRILKGDVIEVQLSGGRVAYVQNIGVHRLLRVVRFLPGVFEKRLDDSRLEALVAGRSLYRSNSIIDLLLIDGSARVIKRLPVPSDEDSVPTMVTGAWSEDPMEWWVTESDGTEMKAHEYLRAHPGIRLQDLPKYNDLPDEETLRKRIETGWTPNN